MADDRHYVPGDYYRIDDESGFKVRASRTRKEWTGLIKRDQSWEARHPQDFVKGVRDDQTVAEARPRQRDVFIGFQPSFYINYDPMYGHNWVIESQAGPDAWDTPSRGQAYLTGAYGEILAGNGNANTRFFGADGSGGPVINPPPPPPPPPAQADFSGRDFEKTDFFTDDGTGTVHPPPPPPPPPPAEPVLMEGQYAPELG